MNIGELLNLVGLSAGVVLYAMLLVMVVRPGRRQAERSSNDRRLLATAILGLIWNLCALAVYEIPKLGVALRYLTAFGFSALGFLPAVVVHSVLRPERRAVDGTVRRWLTVLAYGVGSAAAVLHVIGASRGSSVPAPVGMRLLTYTFICLVLPLAIVTRRQPGARRALWAAALATFAVSALHLSELHRGDASWPVELVGHHASLPLAFAILYQDYPFALADLFLKRALSLLAVVALVFGAIATLGEQSPPFAQFVQLPKQVTLLVTLWVGTVLVFPALRRGLLWFVDAIVLQRPDYRALNAEIARGAQRHHDVSALLADICTQLAPALSARSVTWRDWRSEDDDRRLSAAIITGSEAAALVRSVAPRGAASQGEPDTPALVVTVPTTESPRYVLVIGQLTGGRRFLSDDFAALEGIATVVARRIDAIRLSAERYDRELREREIGRLATEAELRALRAQVNPHFLFNALTTIGYLIQTAPARALQTLMRLTALLRAVLRSEGEHSTLGRELELVEAYLDIERARFEERLSVSVDVPASLRHARVPPLLLQPLVENAIKHGIANKQTGGEVVISAQIECRPGRSSELVLRVRDTGAGATLQAIRQGRRRGVGLQNVERRLACLYGDAASLSIHAAVDSGAVVEVRLPSPVAANSATAVAGVTT